MVKPAVYKTKQQSAILAYLIALDGGHVTVAQIAEHFKFSGLDIGLTTIYRQLEKLIDSGLVRRYSIDGSGAACFQYIGQSKSCESHFHLKCENCGCLIHLECGFLDEIHTHVLNSHDFDINSNKTVFYGKCSECVRKQRETQTDENRRITEEL